MLFRIPFRILGDFITTIFMRTIPLLKTEKQIAHNNYNYSKEYDENTCRKDTREQNTKAQREHRYPDELDRITEHLIISPSGLSITLYRGVRFLLLSAENHIYFSRFDRDCDLASRRLVAHTDSVVPP